MTARTHILEHCARYPLLQPADLLKFLHQSTFGPGHLVAENAGGLEFLRQEAAGRMNGEVEPLDGEFCRFHLGLPLSPETLWQCFRLSSEMPAGTAEDLERRLVCALTLAAENLLPFSKEVLAGAISLWRAAGFPAPHHSEAFRAAYTPAYRVVHRSFARLLPLLAAIDEKRQQGHPVLVALEGGAGSGKSTLGETLQKIYSCPLLHMDDFFLQPHQRTAERLAEAGGNLDRERFLEEVLLPCRRGEPIQYRRYNCRTQTLLPPREIPSAPLFIIEGSYSCHPDLRQHYDLAVFLDISPHLQRGRIERRNAPEVAQRFFDIWIPMENRYFDAFQIPASCDLILEVTP